MSKLGALHTDMYQVTMAYGYWKSGRANAHAVFDLFFRENPFGGEFTIFAGLADALCYVKNFRFTAAEITYVRTLLPHAEEEFFSWLATVNGSGIKIYAQAEGSLVFPRVPLLRIEGDLAIAQMLETPLLNLCNFASLVATNAAHFRLAAGEKAGLMEFGLRRAQGPDGGLSASRYSYMGGFDATSNVRAGYKFGIPVKGTMAHAFIQSFHSLTQLLSPMLKDSAGKEQHLVDLALAYRERLGANDSNEGELASFIAYAQAFPRGFLALVDTYNTIASGTPNFLAVAFALKQCGYQPLGIRLDSGDLPYLSKVARQAFGKAEKEIGPLGKLSIVASNDIERTDLHAFARQGHEIDTFGIGTHLVTCKEQSALGGVFKLVEVDGEPRIKFSENVKKVTIPGKKVAYRLYGKDLSPIMDMLMLANEAPPVPGEPMLAYHPFESLKRSRVRPTKVELLYSLAWDGSVARPSPLSEARDRCKNGIRSLRPDHLRLENPTPYKVAVSEKLNRYIQGVWLEENQIMEVK